MHTMHTSAIRPNFYLKTEHGHRRYLENEKNISVISAEIFGAFALTTNSIEIARVVCKNMRHINLTTGCNCSISQNSAYLQTI